VINFRYHVVSLTAVFLALAIGLIVGTAAANGPAVDALDDRVSQLSGENQQYREKVDHLEDQVNKQDQYATESAAMLLAGRLAGRRVLLLSVEDADDNSDKYAKGVLDMLGVAGAKVVGRVKIREDFTKQAGRHTLLDLAHSAAPPAVSGALPANGDGVETSAALLAALLAGRGDTLVDGTRTVLSAYESQGFLEVQESVTAPAEAVVIAAGQPYADKEKEYRNAAVLTLVERFDQAAPLALAAGSGAGPGNVVRAVRDDPALVKTVSTVDTGATSTGHVVTVMALIDQLAGRVGHYGLAPGATSLMPKPANGS
jgi:hypothetical protein